MPSISIESSTEVRPTDRRLDIYGGKTVAYWHKPTGGLMSSLPPITAVKFSVLRCRLIVRTDLSSRRGPYILPEPDLCPPGKDFAKAGVFDTVPFQLDVWIKGRRKVHLDDSEAVGVYCDIPAYIQNAIHLAVTIQDKIAHLRPKWMARANHSFACSRM